MKPISRRTALRSLGATAGAYAVASSLQSRLKAADAAIATAHAGSINHSVCKWCYDGKVAFEDLCKAAKPMGLQSIELTGPTEWPTLKQYGLTCAMGNGAGMGISKGWNRVENHEALLASYEAILPQAAAAGIPNIICFSGNREKLPDDKGIENCALGLKKLMASAEKHKVNIVMELLNSKIDHHDYQCDHTAWGVELCKQVGSERFKLLYDIYHMQIMEGDVIRTIKGDKSRKIEPAAPYIAHYHTGGVPGRNEIDDTQEIYYPAIMKAILDTGFKGFVAQEFIPARKDALASLKQGVTICTV